MVSLRLVGGPQNGYEYEFDQSDIAVGQVARFSAPGDVDMSHAYHVISSGPGLVGHYIGLHGNVQLENRPTANGFAEFLLGPCPVCDSRKSDKNKVSDFPSNAPPASVGGEPSVGSASQTIGFVVAAVLVIGGIVLISTVGSWNLVVVLICGVVTLGVVGFVVNTLFRW
jgi:hypothetical protein